MELERSLAQIFRRLELWSQFPKYSVERRLDILLTPFIEEFLERELGDPVRLVLPEFPILSEICALAPGGSQTPASLEQVSARTVNADYLLHRGGRNPAWILLELKTDAASLGRKQLRRYAAAQRAGMKELTRHLRSKVLANTEKRHAARYQAVLKRLRAHPSDPIEIVYLAPEVPKDLVPAAVALAEGRLAAPRCHTLADFARTGPYHHDELWKRVRKLVMTLGSRRVAGSARRRSAA